MNKLTNAQFYDMYSDTIDGLDAILDWDEQQLTTREWAELIALTYAELCVDLINDLQTMQDDTIARTIRNDTIAQIIENFNTTIKPLLLNSMKSI